MFAEVILSKATPRLDKIYDYSIPQALADKVQIGSQVGIPFGRRTTIGYVVGLKETSEVKGLKDILEVKSDRPLFQKEALELAKWMSEYYDCFFISALRAVMPPGTAQKEKRKRSGRPCLPARLAKRAGRACSANSRSSKASFATTIKPGLPLTPDQQTALDAIVKSIDSQNSETFLLHGITGSGKTEVYMQAIEHCLKKKLSSIVLVPEISLTPQLIQRFKDRFKDHIAVLHSDLTIKQRAMEWQKAATGQARIVLGTRSAIFAPLKNIGFIVLDEEYEMTYKQDKNPRYHARTVALKLAEQNQATVVLGSATPSIETFYKAQTGEYKLLTLPSRIDDVPLPPVEVIDMTKEKDRMLSGKLADEIENTLSRGEKVILFMNRRGYFTYVICRECGYTLTCPKCSSSLIYHSNERKLRCGRCSFLADATILCPKCQSTSLNYVGMGTQRIEHDVAQIYPEARIIRLDRDTVKKRGSHEVAFAAFSEGEANVLIGTQMVTKGLDMAKVTLVGVITADTAFNLPDFRASEHTFQLLTQVAGRAGRHHLPGKVIVQTFNPEHPSIKFASKHDYEGFYENEIKIRKELNYPPYSELINIILSCKDEKKVIKIAEDLGSFLSKRNIQSLGPIPAPISKIRGAFRYQILLKGKDLRLLRKALNESLENLVIPREVRLTIDIEPMNLL